MQRAKTDSRIKVYYELTKPKIWYLLVFTAFAAAITASNIYSIDISIVTWALMLFGVAAGSAAANTLTNYHDRDIDAIMERTKDRPIPSGRIAPEKARDFGLVLAGISLACAFAISYTTSFWQGVLAGSFMAFGFVLVFISIKLSELFTPWILPILSETSLCISSKLLAYIVTRISNLPVTSAISRTPSILNSSSITLSLCLESILIPVKDFT